MSKFERALREFIYLTVIQAYEGDWVEKTISKEIENSHKEKGINQKQYIENALEEFSFYDYINYLFTEREEWSNEKIIEECKVEIKKQNPNINCIKGILEKSVKKSLWDRLFYKYNIVLVKEDLEIIRSSRNKVMHNKDFSFSEFNSTKKLLKKLTNAIKKEIININEEKYKENANVTAVHNSFRDAFSNALEVSEIFSQLTENFKNVNLGLKEVVLSENQKELRELRKVMEETVIKNNATLINNLRKHEGDFNGLRTISEVLNNHKSPFNLATNEINEISKSFKNAFGLLNKDIFKINENDE